MNKKDTLIKYGFNQDQVHKILSSYIIQKEKDDNFEEKVKSTIEYELQYLSYMDILKQIVRNPSLITYSNAKLEDNRNNFRNLYNDDEITSMYRKEAKLQSLSKEKYNKRNSLFLSLNYSLIEIKKMFLTLPQLYYYDEQNILDRRDKLKNLGYHEQEINKMSVLFPQIYSLSEEHITSIIDYLKENNYTNEEIHIITTSFPAIFSKYNNKSDKNKKEKKITRIENTKLLFLKLNFTEEEFKYIFIKCPSIISYDQQNLEKKLLFFIENNEKEFVLNNPNHLKQSYITSYARKLFLENKGLKLSHNNFKIIFLAERDFKRKFKVTKDEVIKTYKKRLSKDYNTFKVHTK